MLKALKNFEEIFSMVTLAIVIIAVNIEIIGRTLFSVSQGWLTEIATIAFAWSVFVGASACYKRNMHIGIDIFVDLFKAEWQRILAIVSNLILVIANAYFVYLSLIFSISAWAKPTNLLAIPYTYVDLSITVGFTLITVHSCTNLYTAVRSLISSDKEKN